MCGERTLAEPRGGFERSEGGLELLNIVQRHTGGAVCKSATTYRLYPSITWAKTLTRSGRGVREGSGFVTVMGILLCAHHDPGLLADARAAQLAGLVDDDSVFAPLTGVGRIFRNTCSTCPCNLARTSNPD